MVNYNMFDLHIHTSLSSCCSDRRMNPTEILDVAAKLNLHIIGFANHMWDSFIRGGSDWYEIQNVSHVLSIREQIPQNTRGVHVLVGCETEYLGGGIIGISPEAADLFDYILIPATHFHMTDFVAPQMNDCREIALLMKKRFDEIIDLKIKNSGIAHPFLPFGYFDKVEEILHNLGDDALYDSFYKAAKAEISIEITTKFFSTLYENPKFTWPDELFIRVLSIAKEAGCKFHLASDAHNFEHIGLVARLTPILNALSISTNDYTFFNEDNING